MQTTTFRDVNGVPWKCNEYTRSDYEHLQSFNEKFPAIFSRIKSGEKVLETINTCKAETGIFSTSDNILFFYYVENGAFDDAKDLLELIS